MPGVRAGYSLRTGGVSQGPYASFNLGDHVGDDAQDVQTNRAQLARTLGVSPLYLNQVHGTRVQALPAAQGSQADAAYANQAQTACCILVADCLPILFSDDQGSVVAAAHAGWRGLCGEQSRERAAAFQADQVVIGCVFDGRGGVLADVQAQQPALVAKVRAPDIGNEGVQPVVVEAQPVDQGLRLGQAEHARLGVARLAQGGDRADLREAEPEVRPGRDRPCLLVEAGGEADRVGEVQAEGGDGDHGGQNVDSVIPGVCNQAGAAYTPAVMELDPGESALHRNCDEQCVDTQRAGRIMMQTHLIQRAQADAHAGRDQISSE